MWDTVLKAVWAAAVATVLIMHVTTLVSALKKGILRVKLRVKNTSFWVFFVCTGILAWLFTSSLLTYRGQVEYVEDIRTRGITAIAEHDNTTPDELLSGEMFVGEVSYEEAFTERELERNEALIGEYRYRMERLRLVLIGSAVVLTTSLLYITKMGLLPWGAVKPHRLFVESKNGRLFFYTSKTPNRVWLKVRDNAKNRERFAALITEESEAKARALNRIMPKSEKPKAEPRPSLREKLKSLKLPSFKRRKRVFVSEIFAERPERWELRGDPVMWEMLEEHYESIAAPYPAEELRHDILRVLTRLFGKVPDEGDIIFVPEFAKRRGGMSSGAVSADFWIYTAIPLLTERLERLNASGTGENEQ